MNSKPQTAAIRQSIQTEQQAKDELVRELVEALKWYVENDETNEGEAPLPEHGGHSWNEINAPWIDGKRRAEAVLRKAGAYNV